MKLRPHHLIDIMTDYGHDKPFIPHPYGHAVHTVAEMILHNVDYEVEFIVGADTICRPCKYLQPDGQCGDFLHHHKPPVAKQVYNDRLDHLLMFLLEVKPGTVMTVRQFLERVEDLMPGIELVCSHHGENQESRLEGLRKGLQKTGISVSAG